MLRQNVQTGEAERRNRRKKRSGVLCNLLTLTLSCICISRPIYIQSLLPMSNGTIFTDLSVRLKRGFINITSCHLSPSSSMMLVVPHLDFTRLLRLSLFCLFSCRSAVQDIIGMFILKSYICTFKRLHRSINTPSNLAYKL